MRQETSRLSLPLYRLFKIDGYQSSEDTPELTKAELTAELTCRVNCRGDHRWQQGTVAASYVLPQIHYSGGPTHQEAAEQEAWIEARRGTCRCLVGPEASSTDPR